MKKIFLVLGLFIANSLVCSEKSTLEKIIESPKKVIDKHRIRMMNIVTYENGSFEQIRDSAILYILPSFISQPILQQQRNNMRNFLIKNEENALEGVRQYWNLDKESWKEFLEKNKKEHERNLDELRSEKNINTSHHSSLPSQWFASVQRECDRYGLNPNNIGLGVVDNPLVLAETIEIPDFAKKVIKSESAAPIHVNYNLRYIVLPQNSINHTATHEFTHVIKGHDLLRKNIIMFGVQAPIEQKSKEIQEKLKNIEHVSLWQVLNPFYDSVKKIEENEKKIREIQKETRELEELSQNQIKKIDEFRSSSVHSVLVAAQEKTADTYVMCSDQVAAQAVPDVVRFHGYTDNNDGLKGIHNNWKLHEAIEKTKPLRKSTGYDKQLCTII